MINYATKVHKQVLEKLKLCNRVRYNKRFKQGDNQKLIYKYSHSCLLLIVLVKVGINLQLR